MDLLLLLAIFFGRKFLVLLLGHPIGIVEGSHCPLKRILGKLAAGKQAGHLTDQFIDVSRCFCSTLLMGFYGIDICAGEKVFWSIIEEEQYEEAAAVKTARQRNTFEKNLKGIDLFRDLVRCEECGAPMRRRVSSKHRIREGWECTNPDCGQRIRISDTHLLEKVTILMNRIIANSYLLIPRPKKRKELSAEAKQINREIDAELERDDPSDALIIVKTIEMAERLYAETDAHLQITASIARKRVSLMTPQEEFSPAYFSDIAAYLTLGSGGKVILHTKTDVEIGDEENECNQDTQENNIGY